MNSYCVPVYTIYIMGIIIIVLILNLVSLLYLLLCKRYKTKDSYSLQVSIPDAHHPKTSSFHLPKRQFINKFEKLRACSVESDSERNLCTHQANSENESDRNKSYTDRVKNKIPDQIAIIPPDKMAAICDAILNNRDRKVSLENLETPQANTESESDQKMDYADRDRVKNEIPDQIAIIPPDKMAALCDAIINNKDRKVNLENFKKLEIRNDVVYQKNERKSFANLKTKCASVPDLGIYDVITTVRPIEMDESSGFKESDELDQPTVKILKLSDHCERHSGYYKFPLSFRLTYSNSNVI
ncbi:uncharacterized protein LOC123873890 [Maniola jurtina]|uniref:uncharacterized protein LOC123873890 n=1 Tax=Maniola jurtina TaxID=191418 RepID=UPI001E68E524|nr:uncharacterized protein LOC123873890 [Maniola jurtina]XP_045774943.1 uncharacterized protein LOC123873890 [Maniola jurtina]